MPTVDLAANPVDWTFAGWVAETAGDLDGTGLWEAWVQTISGTRLVQIAGEDVPRLNMANLGPIKDDGKRALSASFSLPKNSPARAFISLVTTQLVISRSGRIVFKGPILTRDGGSDASEVNYGARSTRWYLEHRLRGSNEAIYGELLHNPQFDAGLERWDATGLVELDDTRFETGSQSAKVTGATSYVTQNLLVWAEGSAYKLLVQARVWVPAAADPSLGLVVYPPVLGSVVGGSMPITASTPRDQWTTLVCEVSVPAYDYGLTFLIGVQGNDGDDVWVDRMSVGITSFGSVADPSWWQPTTATELDQATIVADTITAVSGGLYLGVDAPLTGVVLPYKLSDDLDRFASEIIQRYIDRDNGVRIFESWTARTSVIRVRYPADGTVHTATSLKYIAGDRALSNCSSYSDQADATAARSRLTLLGDDDARTTASDPAAWGGLQLDDLASAPRGTAFTDLPGLAEKGLRTDDGSVTAWTVELDAGYSALYQVRDTVSFLVDDGGTQIDTVVVIESRNLVPKGDRMQLNLNPVPVP